jgi:hypothetical protein
MIGVSKFWCPLFSEELAMIVLSSAKRVDEDDEE